MATWTAAWMRGERRWPVAAVPASRIRLSRPSKAPVAPGGKIDGMRQRAFVLPVVLIGVLSVCALQGCSISPARQEAIRQAWEERDAERALECRRQGRGYVNGGCTGGGGP